MGGRETDDDDTLERHTDTNRLTRHSHTKPEFFLHARDKDVDVQLLLFESFGGFGKGVREIPGRRRTCYRTS